MSKLLARLEGPIELTMLPLPKGLGRARISGVQPGIAIGAASRAGGREQPFFWPLDGSAAVPFVVDGKKQVTARDGHGGRVAGFVEGRGEGNKLPVVWTVARGAATAALLPVDGYESACALAADARVVVGYGKPRVKKGERAQEAALVWSGGAPTILDAGGKRALAYAVDGDDVAGHVDDNGQRPCLWRRGALIVLDPKALGMVHGAGDGEQVGAIARVVSGALTSRAMLWRGSPSSAVDLTPPEHQSATAHACRGGLQVGVTRARDSTPQGGAALDDHATLWAGAPDDRIDLHSAVPAPWNSSSAVCVAVGGSDVFIGGSIREVEDPLGRGAVVAERAVVWRLRLRA